MPKGKSASANSRQKTVPPTEAVKSTTAPPLSEAVARQYGLHGLHEVGHTAIAHEVIAPNELQHTLAVDAPISEVQADTPVTPPYQPPASPTATKRGFWRKIGHFFAAWWRNKWARYITLLCMAGLLAATAIFPGTRYAVLNRAGVRSTASVVVLDSATRLPLKNVLVKLDAMQAKTDVEGVARFKDLPLGAYTLGIKRVAFASHTQAVTIGWGSNPLGTHKLRPTGIQYTLTATDYVSGKPLAGAEVTNEGVNAVADKQGVITLTVEDTKSTTLAVTVMAPGYRSEAVTLDAEREEDTKVVLVPAYRHVFVSKQSGKYDVFAMDIDGKDRKLLLAGTGLETSNISLAPNATGTRVALVSTRDNARDKDGYLLSTLTLIDVQSGAATVVDRGAQIQLLAWAIDRLVYRIAVPGASAANPNRYRIIAYNADTRAKLQLTSANWFTASLVAGDTVYYAASSDDPKAAMGLFRIKPDGSGKKRVFAQEVWTVVRTAYDTLTLQSPEHWYAYAMGAEQASKGVAPGSLSGYRFATDAQGRRHFWIDVRDGKNTLLLQNTASDQETVLAAQTGIVHPAYWAGERAIIYRVASPSETADYVVSPDGGQPRKISDVSLTYGPTSE